MPEDKKRDLVKLLAERNVPLVENDVYAELYFGTERPKPAKAFDAAGMVLHCGSFSKCLAPGFRVGWAAAGRYFSEVLRAKVSTDIGTNLPCQAAIVEFLKHGGYQHHLRSLRRALATQRDQMLRAIGQYFPPGTRATRPSGGTCLWVELPVGIKALDVHRLAMEQGITLAPGPLFSSRRQYENCFRLNYAIPWSPRLEAALAAVGGIVASLSEAKSKWPAVL
jgi:DNA-binding transcriptional MocR family regulator